MAIVVYQTFKFAFIGRTWETMQSLNWNHPSFRNWAYSTIKFDVWIIRAGWKGQQNLYVHSICCRIYVIKHIILAPDILDLENLDFVSVGKFMKSWIQWLLLKNHTQNFNLALWKNDIVAIWDHFHRTYHICDSFFWIPVQVEADLYCLDCNTHQIPSQTKLSMNFHFHGKPLVAVHGLLWTSMQHLIRRPE